MSVSDARKVVIVGVGALGSHVAPLLRNLGVELTLVDFDRVERKNLRSQFHTELTLGTNKAVAARSTLQHLWGAQSITAIPHRLTSDNVEVLLRGQDLVVDCLDNAEGRRLVQAYCRREGAPACVHAGLAADGAFGLVEWTETFVPDEEPSQGAATCEDGEHLPFIAAVAAWLGRAVQVYLQSGEKVGFGITPRGTQRI